MRLTIFFFTVFWMTVCFPGFSQSEEPRSNRVWPDAPAIHIQVDAKTWKTRGRLYWDVEGSLIKKLKTTGFTIVRKEEDPHTFTLKVLYREEQGEQYGINTYGTVIHGTFFLDPPPNGSPWELNISEASTNVISGTPPYLDALDKFYSNPYYFFVGEILRGTLEKGLDPRGGLIYALEGVRSVEPGERKESGTMSRDAGSHLHTADSEREFYETRAILRAIDDCVNNGDRRVVPVLSQLLNHPDSEVRRRSLEGMASLKVEESRAPLFHMAQHAPDLQVRKTAKTIGPAFISANPSQQPAQP